jgi:hypothetical protein
VYRYLQQLYVYAQRRVRDANVVILDAATAWKISLKRKVLLCYCVFASVTNVIIYNWFLLMLIISVRLQEIDLFFFLGFAVVFGKK